MVLTKSSVGPFSSSQKMEQPIDSTYEESTKDEKWHPTTAIVKHASTRKEKEEEKWKGLNDKFI